MFYKLVKHNWKGLLLWSNQFYGICAVLLSIESSLRIIGKIPSVPTLLFIHLLTVIYYTHAYLLENKDGIYNERSEWYINHKSYLYYRQAIYSVICMYIGLVRLNFFKIIEHIDLPMLLVFLFTMLFCFLYYIPSVFPKIKNSIRSYGILKSISIAWVWTITCSVFPVWMSSDLLLIYFNNLFWFHFIQLFIFILILAVLFDIKDINRDQLEEIETLALKIGKDRIIKYLIAPLLFIFVSSLILDWSFLHEPISFLVLHLLLILLILLVSKLVTNLQSIFLNVLLIDGLMIIKVILSSFIFLK